LATWFGCGSTGLLVLSVPLCARLGYRPTQRAILHDQNACGRTRRLTAQSGLSRYGDTATSTAATTPSTVTTTVTTTDVLQGSKDCLTNGLCWWRYLRVQHDDVGYKPWCSRAGRVRNHLLRPRQVPELRRSRSLERLAGSRAMSKQTCLLHRWRVLLSKRRQLRRHAEAG
jgi:hypothetical protein